MKDQSGGVLVKANLFLRAFVDLLIKWLQALKFLIRTFSRICAKRRERKDLSWHKIPVRCLPIPKEIIRRPDPSIYSQHYLWSLGIQVTWDNPDIKLYDPQGKFADSYNLKADTEYTIQATVHNRSTEAPAFSIPVLFNYRKWGASSGAGSTYIGTDVIDLPVCGGVGEPTTAKVNWKTPSEAGHYCIEVKIICPNDLNPGDNLGQENTNVINSSQSTVSVRVPIINPFSGNRVFQLSVNGYAIPRKPIPQPEIYRERDNKNSNKPSTIMDPKKRLSLVIGANRIGNFPVSEELNAKVSETEVELEPREETEVMLSFEKANEEHNMIRKCINLTTIDKISGQLIGGVTIIV